MSVFAPSRTPSRLAGVLVVLLGLFLAGGRAARADDNEPPVNVTAQADGPKMVFVSWLYGGDVGDLSKGAFTVSNLTTGESYPSVDATSATISNLLPSTPYQFHVCANYPTGQACADSNSITTAQPSTDSTPTGVPIITGNDAGFGKDGKPYIGLSWESGGTSYINYVIDYVVKGAPASEGHDVHPPGTGGPRYHQVGGLLPGTTYIFWVRGCFDDRAGQDIPDCSYLSQAYEATTLQVANASNRPTPNVVAGDGSSSTAIAISWSVTPKYSYDHYVIKYQPAPAAGGAPGASVTDQVPGDQLYYTALNLTPGTAYTFTVQGCDLILIPTPGVDCATASAPYTATAKDPPPLVTTGGGSLGGVPSASLNVSQPTVTAGNTVKVTGQDFTDSGGTVTLTLSGSGSPVTLGTATPSQDGFSTTVTIPSGTTAGSYTIHAQATGAKADVSIQVTAPSSKQTLTVTDSSGAVATSISSDNPYTLTGTNFAPGFGVTVYLDSKTGPQLGTATAGQQDETFTMTIDVTTAQIGNKNGNHALVVVSNGFVVAQVTLPFVVGSAGPR